MQAFRIAAFFALLVTLVHAATGWSGVNGAGIVLRNLLLWQLLTALVFGALGAALHAIVRRRAILAVAPTLIVGLEISAWLVERNAHHTLGPAIRLAVFAAAWVAPAIVAWLFVRRGPALRFMGPVQVALLLGAAGSALVTLDRRDFPDDRPDLALFVLDAVQVRALGHLGAPLDPSPNIDSLATRGWTSTAAFSAASTSIPGHAAILYGLNVAEHGAPTNDFDLPDTLPAPLAERLRDRGYTTRGFCHNPLVSTKAGFARGFDVWWNWGERTWLQGPARLVPLRWPAIYVWLRASDRDLVTLHARLGIEGARGPLFTFVQLLYTHDSYVDGDGWATPDRVAQLREALQRGELSNRTDYSDEEIAGLFGSYLGSVNYSDRLVGDLLQRLVERAGERGLVVAITADHGENLAEHGDDAVAKHFGYWSTSLRIPLVVADTRVETAGIRDERLASNQRIPRIFLDAADLHLPAEPDGWAQAVGRSLHLDPAFIYSEPWMVLVDDSLKVAIDRTDLATPPRVHRWRTDFEDQQPVEGSAASRAKWEDLMALHERMLEAGLFERPTDLDPEKLEHLRALGYIE